MRDKEQQRFGELKKSVTFIRRGRNVIDEDILLNTSDINRDIFNKIVYLIDNNPEWNDEDIAEEVINNNR